MVKVSRCIYPPFPSPVPPLMILQQHSWRLRMAIVTQSSNMMHANCSTMWIEHPLAVYALMGQERWQTSLCRFCSSPEWPEFCTTSCRRSIAKMTDNNMHHSAGGATSHDACRKPECTSFVWALSVLFVCEVAWRRYKIWKKPRN